MPWSQAAIVAVNGGTVLFGSLQLIGPNDWVRTATAGANALAAGGRIYRGLTRSGQVAAGYVEDNLGDIPGFHDLIDPTTPKRTRSFEIRDWIVNSIVAGACSYAWGIHDYLTVNDPTSLVGVGFEHGPDYVLKTFLKDAPAGALPPRVIRQVVTGSLANVGHELAVVFDGYNKNIKWYIDGVLVDVYTPVVPLDQIGGGAAALMQKFRYRGFVPANGNMNIYRFAGGATTPLLLLTETSS